MPAPNLEDERARPLDGPWVVLFLAFLVLPAALLAARGDRSADVAVEKRVPAPPPSLAARDLPALPAAFDAWYRDAFGLREPLVRLHARLHWSLGHCPDPTMLRGGDGWLFLDDPQAEALQARPRPFGERQLAAWRTGLEAWREWLAERDVALVVALVPSKARLYPERAPAARVERDVDRMRMLQAELRRAGLRVVDLEPALADARAEDRDDLHDWVYSPHGIHWSSRGAFAAYGALVTALEPLLARAGATRAPLERSRFELEWQPGAGDSWAPSLYLDDVLEVGRWQLVDDVGAALTREVLRPTRPRVERLEQARDDLPRVLLVHDSFGPYLYEFLGAHASRLDGVNQRQLDLECVERAAPDLVVWLQAERVLDVMLPGLALGRAGEEQRAAFEAARDVLWDGAAPKADDRLRATPTDAGLALEGGPGGALRLPALEVPSEACALLRVDLQVSEPTPLHVIARPAAGSSAQPRELLLHDLEPGGAPLHLRLWDLAPDERLELVFSRGVRDALLVDLELRAGALPAHAR